MPKILLRLYFSESLFNLTKLASVGIEYVNFIALTIGPLSMKRRTTIATFGITLLIDHFKPYSYGKESHLDRTGKIIFCTNFCHRLIR